MAKYRIVKDGFRGFEVQYKPKGGWFWRQVDRHAGVNTFDSFEKAKAFAIEHAMLEWPKLPYYLGELPATDSKSGEGDKS